MSKDCKTCRDVEDWLSPSYSETIASTNPKDVMGSKKDLIHLVPTEAIRSISRAMKYGARDAKRADGQTGYGDYNWRSTKVRLTVYLDAIMRHTMAILDGEDLDKIADFHIQDILALI